MPKKNSKVKQRKSRDLSVSQLNVICSYGGLDLLDFEDPFLTWTSKQLVDLWFKNRDFILSLRGKKHPDADFLWFNHGERPAWFWKYEAADFKPKLTGLSYEERRAKIKIQRFEYLKKNNLLFEGEESLYFKQIEKKLKHYTRRWSRKAALESMKVELNYLRKWQRNNDKTAK